MSHRFLGLLALLLLMSQPTAHAQRDLATIKADIIALAESYRGQGDPDFSRQRSFQPLLDELLQANPQPPVSERLPILFGPWLQVWGPYDYRNNDRGIDPKNSIDEIYQVVFDGYYWNVAPVYRSSDRQEVCRIATLRGEYQLVDNHPNFLKVQFTRFPGVKGGRPQGINLWELAALAEKNQLPNQTTIVPSFIVRWFFGGGYLREVYTDDTLRITYGGENLTDRSDEYIYIMVRPQ